MRRFLRRGLAKVQGEWTLGCLTHNLGRIVPALRTVTGLRERLVMATVFRRSVGKGESTADSLTSNPAAPTPLSHLPPVQLRHTPSVRSTIQRLGMTAKPVSSGGLAVTALVHPRRSLIQSTQHRSERSESVDPDSVLP